MGFAYFVELDAVELEPRAFLLLLLLLLPDGMKADADAATN